MDVTVGRESGPDDPEPAGEELSEDTVFSLLSAGRRREVLRILDGADGEVPISRLTRQVALAEGVEADADATQFKKVYVSLYQTHVPALEAAGVVEYDRESKVVRVTPRAAPLFAQLDVVGSDSTGAKGLLSRLFGHEVLAN